MEKHRELLEEIKLDYEQLEAERDSNFLTVMKNKFHAKNKNNNLFVSSL